MGLQHLVFRAASTSYLRRRFKKLLRGKIWNNLEFCLWAFNEGLVSESLWFISVAISRSCLKNVKHPHYLLNYPVMFWILNLNSTYWQGFCRLAKGFIPLCSSKPAVWLVCFLFYWFFRLFSCHTKIYAGAPKHFPRYSPSFLLPTVNAYALNVPSPSLLAPHGRKPSILAKTETLWPSTIQVKASIFPKSRHSSGGHSLYSV